MKWVSNQAFVPINYKSCLIIMTMTEEQKLFPKKQAYT